MLGVGHADSNSPEVDLVSGDDLPDGAKATPPQQVAGAGRNDHLSSEVELIEGREVEMVVVDVGDEHHVGSCERCRVDGSLPAEVHDALAKHRVGDDHQTVELERDTAVSEPRQSSRLRLGSCSGDRPAGL
jgi:hypothetical protein